MGIFLINIVSTLVHRCSSFSSISEINAPLSTMQFLSCGGAHQLLDLTIDKLLHALPCIIYHVDNNEVFSKVSLFAKECLHQTTEWPITDSKCDRELV